MGELPGQLRILLSLQNLNQIYHRDGSDVTKLEVEWQILAIDGNISNVPIYYHLLPGLVCQPRLEHAGTTWWQHSKVYKYQSLQVPLYQSYHKIIHDI
jgi:hypothetical protein